MRNALSSLLLALAGSAVMSEMLEQLAASIFDGVVPHNWLKFELNPGNSALGTWFKVLSARADQLRVWAENGAPPPVLLITLLFNPLGVITCTLQTSARANGWALDQVSFSLAVLGPTCQAVVDHH